MAAPDVNTAEGRAEALLLLEPDFHGLLQRKDVSELLQAKLAVAGIKSISRFSAVADSRAQLRTFCERPLAMDPARDAVLVASILDA